ncbi:MAG: hypothetical protein IPG16_02235 [Comamonadaceae bacterium]|jgi:hypothetical protein|nr:hypothetical protein [Comamonadaceae bacterium]
MSLAIALEQIRKPSWLAEENPPTARRHRNGDANRETVLQAISEAGRPVNCQWVANATGMSKETIRYVTQVLVEDGDLVKVVTTTNRVMWRVGR